MGRFRGRGSVRRYTDTGIYSLFSAIQINKETDLRKVHVIWICSIRPTHNHTCTKQSSTTERKR